MPRLEMRTGRHAGKTFELSKAVILGRGDNVGVRVPDGKASREHCRVFQQAGTWVVVDLNSRNGITVNGVKTTRKELVSGDEIAIGETILAYVDEAAAGKPKPRAPEPGEIVVDEIDLDADAAPAKPARGKTPAKAGKPAQAAKSAKGRSAKDAAFAAARADASRRAQRASGGGGGGGETGMQVSDKVLQFNRVDARSANPLSMELSQYPVVVQIAIVVCGLAVLGTGIWLILR